MNTTTHNVMLLAGTYIFVESFGDNVVTNIISKGVVLPGPTVTKKEWAAIKKGQSLAKNWCEADSKATRYYKQSRYWIVNGGASESRIDKTIERMEAWEIKRTKIWNELNDLGFNQF